MKYYAVLDRFTGKFVSDRRFRGQYLNFTKGLASAAIYKKREDAANDAHDAIHLYEDDVDLTLVEITVRELNAVE